MRPLDGLGLLIGLPAAGLRLAASAPTGVARHVVPLANAGARAAVRSAVTASHGAVRLGRATQQAVTAGSCWVGDRRLHVPLRARPGVALDRRQVEAAAKKVARSLAEHPEVLAAYWDGGLESLVVRLAQDAVADTVAGRAVELADAHQLEQPAEPMLDHDHPGQAPAARVHAAALGCDVAGIVTATAARVLRLRSSPRMVTAAVTALREDSRPRTWLQRRLGTPATDVVLSAAYAAASGSPRRLSCWTRPCARVSSSNPSRVPRCSTRSTIGCARPNGRVCPRPGCGGPAFMCCRPSSTRTRPSLEGFWVRLRRWSSCAMAPRQPRRCSPPRRGPPAMGPSRSPPPWAPAWPVARCLYGTWKGSGSWSWSTRSCCTTP